MDYTPIFEAFISFVFVVIGVIVVPYFKTQIDANKLTEIIKWVEIFVQSAEQIYKAGKGEEKKAYVMKKLEEKGYKIDLDVLSDLVESEVLKLKKITI